MSVDYLEFSEDLRSVLEISDNICKFLREAGGYLTFLIHTL